MPVSYVDKLPFPVRVKEYAVITKVVKKSGNKAKDHDEQLKVQSSVALVKDLTGENIEGGHIIFYEDASNIVRPPKGKAKKVGAPIISMKIGDHCYYGLCDIGASSSLMTGLMRVFFFLNYTNKYS